MPTTVAIGFSQAPDCQKAVFEACLQVKNRLNSSETDLIIIFASGSYATADILPTIARTLRPKRLIGSSTGGILLSDIVTNRGVAIIGINSTDIHFGLSACVVNPKDMHKIGFEMSRQAVGNLNVPGREMFLMLGSGIEKNSSAFLKGVQETFGVGFPIIGALSSDDYKNTQLKQFFQDQILEHAMVGVVLGGINAFALGCKHGFKPLGKPRTITKMTNNIIHTIDQKPAVDIYQHFLGKEVEQLKKGGWNSYAMLYPLGIYLEEDRQYLLRNPIDILADGSIVCQGSIPRASEVHLMISNKEACRRSAVDAAETIKARLSGKQAKLVLIFESLSHHKILGSSAFYEIQAIKEVLGYTTPIAGMCSYGEIAPFGSLDQIKNTYLHNETVLIVALT